MEQQVGQVFTETEEKQAIKKFLKKIKKDQDYTIPQIFLMAIEFNKKGQKKVFECLNNLPIDLHTSFISGPGKWFYEESFYPERYAQLKKYFSIGKKQIELVTIKGSDLCQCETYKIFLNKLKGVAKEESNRVGEIFFPELDTLKAYKEICSKYESYLANNVKAKLKSKTFKNYFDEIITKDKYEDKCIEKLQAISRGKIVYFLTKDDFQDMENKISEKFSNGLSIDKFVILLQKLKEKQQQQDDGKSIITEVDTVISKLPVQGQTFNDYKKLAEKHIKEQRQQNKFNPTEMQKPKTRLLINGEKGYKEQQELEIEDFKGSNVEDYEKNSQCSFEGSQCSRYFKQKYKTNPQSVVQNRNRSQSLQKELCYYRGLPDEKKLEKIGKVLTMPESEFNSYGQSKVVKGNAQKKLHEIKRSISVGRKGLKKEFADYLKNSQQQKQQNDQININ